ncbi:flavodoxin domain-containing protein [Facklamia lactis]|uniref:flavodoxin domain-containing protein n=1 Tax=Facklamia lactis TaxID=2749967 RepID=UPI0018CD5823|nr:flavodoxin domain-containing protein [Facklamia lactis]MBG9980578.1 hypothetical protein [Facklamia lactis]
MRAILLYEGSYGSTAVYARAIKESFDLPVCDLQEVGPQDLKEYDLIIIGTSIISREIYQVDKIEALFTAYPEKFWILYTVGLSTPELTNFDKILIENFSPAVRSQLVLFHFRARIVSKRFLLMYLASKRMRKQPGTTIDDVILGPEEMHLLNKFGATVELSDLKQVQKLVDYIRVLEQYYV